MTFPDISEVSYHELRTLSWLLAVGGPLVCEGTNIWSLPKRPGFTTLRDTVRALEQRGFIRRLNVQDSVDCDNFELTPFGQEFFQRNKAHFERLIDARIDETIESLAARGSRKKPDHGL